MTDAETVLNTLADILRTGLGETTVEKNTELPEKIPASGIVIVRDGDPGEPDQVLGGFDSCYYAHQIDIEIGVCHGNAETRDARYAQLIRSIGDILINNKTLGGLVQGMTYGYPIADTANIDGAADMKSATIPLVVEYETAQPLS